MSKYTTKTLDLLREHGYKVGGVEKYQFHTRVRQDLFGWIDIIAIKEGELLGVQSTSYQARKQHIDKMAEASIQDMISLWCKTGAKALMITWKKQKIKRGGTAFRYVPVFDQYVIRDSSLCLESPEDMSKLNG